MDAGERLLEVTLISAQGLKPPPGLRRRLQAYAVAWVDPAHKVRTRVDRVNGADPTWHDRLLFRIRAAALADDSAAAVSVEICAAAAAWLISGDSPVGSVRLLLANHRLLERPVGSASFAAVGIRRASGRIHGVLNVAVGLLAKVPVVAADALRRSPAVAYHDLMDRATLRVLNHEPPPSPTPPPPARKAAAVVEVVKRRQEVEVEVEDEVEWGETNGVLFCGPCILPFPRRIHISPSDENLQVYGGGGIEESPHR